MRLQDLLAGVPQVEEIQVWGHVLQAGDICLQLAGLARSGQTVTLYGLEYNPTYRAQDTLLGDVVKRPQTNRELLRPEQTSHLWLSGARQIELEQTVYAMGRCTWDNLYNGLCGDWQDLLTLAEFLRQGLVLLPQLAQKSCRDLYWVALSWRGDYDALPLSAPPQSLKLESGDRWQREALSEKWLWSVGEQQNEACSFAASGGQRTFYLDKVELVDIRAQIEQQFDSPLYRQRLTQEEWQENKRETLQLLEDT